MIATDSTALPLTTNAKTMHSLQAAMAAMMLPHHKPADKAWQQIHLLLLEADATDDCDRRAVLRERARNYLVRCGEACMAGRPLPTLHRLPARRARSKGSQRGAAVDADLANDPVLQAMAEDLGQAAVLIGIKPSSSCSKR